MRKGPRSASVGHSAIKTWAGRDEWLGGGRWEVGGGSWELGAKVGPCVGPRLSGRGWLTGYQLSAISYQSGASGSGGRIAGIIC